MTPDTDPAGTPAGPFSAPPPAAAGPWTEAPGQSPPVPGAAPSYAASAPVTDTRFVRRPWIVVVAVIVITAAGIAVPPLLQPFKSTRETKFVSLYQAGAAELGLPADDGSAHDALRDARSFCANMDVVPDLTHATQEVEADSPQPLYLLLDVATVSLCPEHRPHFRELVRPG